MSVDAAIPPRGRRAALAFIFVTVLIDVLSFGLIIPVLPHLVQKLNGGDIEHAAYWVGLFSMVFAAVQFLSSPIQGALSDRFGRRPVILISCLGLGLDFVFMALAPTLAWLMVGRIISAIASASFTTANAYIADITAPEQRGKAFGMIGAAFGLGFIIGPILGGELSVIDLRMPFWGAACLSLLNFCYGLFVLPESLAPGNRAPRFDWTQARPFASLAVIKRYPQITDLIVIVLLAASTHYVYQSTFVLYGDVRYGWGPQGVSYVLAVVGVLSVIVNAGLVGRMIKRFGEQRAMMLGLGCGVIGFAIYGLAAKPWMFYLGLPISALWAVSQPAAQALMTREVGADAQGRLQGAIMSLVSLAGIAAPMTYAATFGFFIGKRAPVYLPGAAFFLAATVLACAWLIAVRHARRHAATEPATA
ncbi:TCR/Tet family MFS transporter [Cognatilysobacter lacus]|uniref:TCR/Tet family MFS transporter n=1 Tax=Cognatilysobacter lacus TaxID=1643323 RepID=A0A5D8YY65_9GAMM|nr:TCR/Tet family MFS transporter [Lysobacter lacus]TZF87658.1 TCR/Tet family MFS transporter [Lysobacter lacus]